MSKKLNLGKFSLEITELDVAAPLLIFTVGEMLTRPEKVVGYYHKNHLQQDIKY